MIAGYRFVERFSPASGDAWARYIAWSGYAHLAEVVGLDCMLNPPLLCEYEAADWPHVVFGEHLFGCFGDIEFARRRVQDRFEPVRHQLLALAREPAEHELQHAQLQDFRFLGFDLIEEATGISALANCTGFARAFTPQDLSACGLVTSASRAYAIRSALATCYPDENHADCAVWAVWRFEPGLEQQG